MKREFRKIFILVLPLVFSLALALPADASKSYNSLLKKWTRHDRVFVWDNLEARLVWSATYLSDEFREGRLRRVGGLYEWTPEERSRREKEDRAEAGRFDVFFLAVYAGSSQWPEVGKDNGKWRIVLEPEGRRPVESVSFEKIPVTELERTLYPYLDKWSEAYLVKFPKVITGDGPFRLRMTGLPARSELVWKNR